MRAVLVLLAAAASVASLRAVTFESGSAQTTLMELYTSEGCRSCPPAEKRLSELRTDVGLWKNVVPVAFHVDYWDGLGWPDRYATPQFTRRQREYGALWRAQSIYTPAFVLNGRDSRDVDSAPDGNPGRLRAEVVAPGKVTITFRPETVAKSGLIAEVAPLAGGLVTDVRRGENAGRQLAHDFIALALVSAPLEERDGGWTATVSWPQDTVAPTSALAVWVHPVGDPTPIQATGGWLKN